MKGKARQGKGRDERQGKAGQEQSRQGKTKQSKERKAGQSQARNGKAGQGRAGQGRAGQGRARQGQARKGKERPGQLQVYTLADTNRRVLTASSLCKNLWPHSACQIKGYTVSATSSDTLCGVQCGLPYALV